MSQKLPTLNLVVERGTRTTLAVTIKEDANTPEDITGATFAAQITNPATGEVLVEGEIDVLDAEAGEISVTFPPEATPEREEIAAIYSVLITRQGNTAPDLLLKGDCLMALPATLL